MATVSALLTLFAATLTPVTWAARRHRKELAAVHVVEHNVDDDKMQEMFVPFLVPGGPGFHPHSLSTESQPFPSYTPEGVLDNLNFKSSVLPDSVSKPAPQSKKNQKPDPVSVQYFIPRKGPLRSSSDVNSAFVQQLREMQKNRFLLNEADICSLISAATEALDRLPSLVEVTVPPNATLHVVGDLHGQYLDLMSILDKFKDPGPTNLYVFNGDFVDRGQMSVEVITLLLAMKLAFPDFVHLNRGNHEARSMNMRYGFYEELLTKYSHYVYELFRDSFLRLPLATLVNHDVLVVHGGLPQRKGVLLQDIKEINRKREPGFNDVMTDLLWADPMSKKGLSNSSRNVGVTFGPDITKTFCENNLLQCVVRSHQVIPGGYEWDHDDRLVTVFSAPDYQNVGNAGAILDIEPSDNLRSSNLIPRVFAPQKVMKQLSSIFSPEEFLNS